MRRRGVAASTTINRLRDMFQATACEYWQICIIESICDNPLNQNLQNLALSLKQGKKTLHHFNLKFHSSFKSYIYDIYSILKFAQFPK